MAMPHNCLPKLDRIRANYHPCIWGDRFLSFSYDKTICEGYEKEIEVLKERVREMLMSSTKNSVEKMNLIDSLCRLGLSYHFESEIEDQLKHLFDNFDHHNHYDLYTVSLQFRIFRQHGFKLSSDVFRKFTDSNNKFRESLASDTRGMLSLYEATHLRIHEDQILDEALIFTTSHLSTMAVKSTSLGKQVMQALRLPLHKGIPRIEARRYISYYEEDESRDETLLLLAKLDFNLLQLLHQEELRLLSKWRKDLNFGEKLSYARDRMVELYLWVLGVYFEPQYSQARIIATKLVTMMSLLDDTYDFYGTPQELEVFTHAIERWDAGAIDELPDYMKVYYKTLLDLTEDLDKEMTEEGRSYSVHYTKKALIELARGYHKEEKWFHKSYIPKFEEYLRNAMVTSAYLFITASCFIGIKDVPDKQAFDWLHAQPTILRASQIISRLLNDIVSHEAEQERGDVGSGIECYMNEYGVSKEDAIKEIRKIMESSWKDANEELLRPTPISMKLTTAILNLLRVAEVVYEYDDGYTKAERVLKEHVISLFVHPIPI